MIITDHLIYLELHKTGCTHTRKILTHMFADSHIKYGKHEPCDKVPKELLANFDKKLKVGNIRNPWDWYVSLWAFGCQKEGAFFNRLTKDRGPEPTLFSNKGIKASIKKYLGIDYPYLSHKVWEKLYSDPNNSENFRSWLKIVLSQEKINIGEGFKQSKVSNFSGLLTFRYLNLYSNRVHLNKVNSFSGLEEFDKKNNFMNVIIKNENLHEDIVSLADKLHYNKDDLTSILTEYQNRTNISARERDYRKYYCQNTISLVEKYEKLIIEKYNYSFE